MDVEAGLAEMAHLAQMGILASPANGVQTVRMVHVGRRVHLANLEGMVLRAGKGCPARMVGVARLVIPARMAGRDPPAVMVDQVEMESLARKVTLDARVLGALPANLASRVFLVNRARMGHLVRLVQMVLPVRLDLKERRGQSAYLGNEAFPVCLGLADQWVPLVLRDKRRSA